MRTRRPKPIQRQFLQIHAATFAVVFSLGIANAYSVFRPLPRPLAAPPTLDTAPAQTEVRRPASSNPLPGKIGNTDLDSTMREIQVACERTLAPIRLAASVRQVRFVFAPCTSPVAAVVNETNGFQATVFNQNATDYVTLEADRNKVRVSRLGSVEMLQIERF